MFKLKGDYIPVKQFIVNKSHNYLLLGIPAQENVFFTI